jgi:transposase
MAFREVTVLEVKEVLRLWLAGTGIKEIRRQLGVGRNTVRRYIAAARKQGVEQSAGTAALTDALVAAVLTTVRVPPSRERGESWAACEARRSFIEQQLEHGLRLTKVHRLLKRSGVEVPYQTLHRFAHTELDFGKSAPTLPVADCGPGEEVQLDTGWMTLLEPDVTGRRRRFRAWIFTSVHSRHRFVYASFEETTAMAIEACEAAWRFFGGVFRAVIIDNTKAIVDRADPLGAKLIDGFLEYTQARGFVIDTTRVRKPKDKARVERAVTDVREDCFRGERLLSIADARRRGEIWSREEYGMRRHSSTGRLPLEHFEAVEKSVLLPAPLEPYDVPVWCDPKVGPDQHAAVCKALYPLPREYRGKKLRARADSKTVRFYFRGQLIQAYPRQPAGKRAQNPALFPAERWAYASRDGAFLIKRAETAGAHVGRFARTLLEMPQPWTRMRQCFALLGLCRRYGEERVDEACKQTLDAGVADIVDVRRLERVLKLARAAEPMPGAKVLPLARHLRPASQYALPLARRDGGDTNNQDEGDK